MQRRSLLKLGLASSALLAVVSAMVLPLQGGLRADGRLSLGGRNVFAAVGRAVLDGSLPTVTLDRNKALAAHLDRLDETIAGFPPFTRAELSRLLAVLASVPGRWMLAGLAKDWEDSNAADVQAALQSMRLSHFALRQQAYQALRDLTNAAYYAHPSTWQLLGYESPQDAS